MSHDETEANTCAGRINQVRAEVDLSVVEGASALLDQEHLTILAVALEDAPDPDSPRGKKARSFGQALRGVEPDQLPETMISRAAVFTLARNPTVSTPTVCAAILAWGGMRVANRDSLWASEKWLAVGDLIRAGNLERQSAYGEFEQLYNSGKLKGMGPAFYTKIIYFLSPRTVPRTKTAYIMDQWAGCSINLLCGQNVVLMDMASTWKRGAERPEEAFIVSKANTDKNYEDFCVAMDAVALHFDKSPDQIDRVVLGDGGRKQCGWRRYVIDNRRQI